MVGETPVARTAQEGKFLSFVLGEEEYGLEILKVQEINSMTGITSVPWTPEYVSGVINLRGRVIPIVNLRRKFNLPVTADTEKTCIIVVQVDHADDELTMGIVVDEVSDVLNIRGDQIEPAPGFGGGMAAADFVTGMGKLEDKSVILMDIDCVLNSEEIDAVIQSVN